MSAKTTRCFSALIRSSSSRTETGTLAARISLNRLSSMAIASAFVKKSVSSGAHFGVHGRIVGSFLSLLTAIAFFSLSVWSSGDALIGGAKRLIGLPETDLTLGLAYGLFALLVLKICIYGFRLDRKSVV